MMKIRDIMTPQVSTISAAATVRDAALQMRTHDIGVLPVQEDKRLVGMLTDRDITIRAVAEGRDPNQISVRDAMTPEVVSCFEDDPVSEVGRIMQQRQVRRIVVLNRKEELVGICSIGDIAVQGDSEKLGNDMLQSVSRPEDEQAK